MVLFAFALSRRTGFQISGAACSAITIGESTSLTTIQKRVGIVWHNTAMTDTETLEVERLARDDRSALLTVGEVAARLRISERTVWRRVRSGELDAVRLGNAGSAVRIRARSVRELMRPYEGVADD
jgi:excisionase family DNA binding protein